MSFGFWVLGFGFLGSGSWRFGDDRKITSPSPGFDVSSLNFSAPDGGCVGGSSSGNMSTALLRV